ncbi:MAG: hypothetical protein ACOYN4_14580 [Bacteroidales bacterium]
MKTFFALCLVLLTCTLFEGSSSGPPDLNPVNYAFVKSFDVGQFAPVQVPTALQFKAPVFTLVDLPFIQVDLPFAEVPTLNIQNSSFSETITALQSEREVLKLLNPDRNCMNCQYSILKTVFLPSSISYNCPLPYS